MCESHLSRRELMITGGIAAAAATAGVLTRRGELDRTALAAPAPSPSGAVLPVQVRPGLFVRPRASWGPDLVPRGPIEPETVQFLLVHHSATSEDYGPGGAPAVLRATFAYHTSSAKGWPDVCYQFFIDRDGIVYEGRTGALAGPVRADATGGSQGFAQLVCLLGDFTDVEPSPAMATSLVQVLAWLAERYGIDTSPGATTSFVSRGSQRHRAGVKVTTPTIAGHRDMSYTACPGDHVYARLAGGLREQVHAQREIWRDAPYQAVRVGPTNADRP